MKSRRSKHNIKRLQRISPKLLKAMGVVILLIVVYVFGYPFVYSHFAKVNDLASSQAHIISRDPSLRKVLVVTETKNNDVEAVFYALYNRDNNEGVLIYLPAEVYLPSADKLGIGSKKVCVRDIKYTAQTYDRNEADFVINLLGNTLALYPDSYIILTVPEGRSVDRIAWVDTLSQIGKYKKMHLTGDVAEIQIRASNLKLNEIEAVRDELLLVDWNDRNIIDVSTEAFSQETANVLGESIRVADLHEIDDSILHWRERLLPADVKREHGRVEVYNASDVSGLGGFYARLVRNSCCDVLRVGNADGDFKGIRAYVVDPERYANTVRYLQNSIGVDLEVINGRPDFMTTGDVVLIVGDV